MKKFSFIAAFFFSIANLWGQAQVSRPSLNVREIDLSPSSYPIVLQFQNDSVTMNGSTATIIPLIYIADEGIFSGSVSSLNFIGSGVSASASGGIGTINVTGGGGGGGGSSLRLERNGVDDISVSTINITRDLQYIKFTSSANFFVDLSTVAASTRSLQSQIFVIVSTNSPHFTQISNSTQVLQSQIFIIVSTNSPHFTQISNSTEVLQSQIYVLKSTNGAIFQSQISNIVSTNSSHFTQISNSTQVLQSQIFIIVSTNSPHFTQIANSTNVLQSQIFNIVSTNSLHFDQISASTRVLQSQHFVILSTNADAILSQIYVLKSTNGAIFQSQISNIIGTNVLTTDVLTITSMTVYGTITSTTEVIASSMNIQSGSFTARGVSYLFPSSRGSNGQVLKENGSGVLSWSNDNNSGGGGGASLRLERNGIDALSVATISINNEIQFIQFTSSAVFFVDFSTIAASTRSLQSQIFTIVSTNSPHFDQISASTRVLQSQHYVILSTNADAILSQIYVLKSTNGAIFQSQISNIVSTNSAVFSSIAIATGNANLPPGSTSYIQNTNNAQANAIFSVTSGTVDGLLTATTMYAKFLGVGSTIPVNLSPYRSLANFTWRTIDPYIVLDSSITPMISNVSYGSPPLRLYRIYDSDLGPGITPAKQYFDIYQGNYSLGNDSTHGRLIFSNGSDRTLLQMDQNERIAFLPGGSSGNNMFEIADTTLVITIDGNIGVGMRNPTSKFDLLNGSITIRGSNPGLESSGTIKGDLLRGTSAFIYGTITSTTEVITSSLNVQSGSATFNGISYLFPASRGSNGQVLKEDGSGTLTWSNDNNSGGGGGSSLRLERNGVDALSVATISINNQLQFIQFTSSAIFFVDFSTIAASTRSLQSQLFMLTSTNGAIFQSQISNIVGTNVVVTTILNIGSITVKGSITSTSAIIASSGIFDLITISTLSVSSINIISPGYGLMDLSFSSQVKVGGFRAQAVQIGQSNSFGGLHVGAFQPSGDIVAPKAYWRSAARFTNTNLTAVQIGFTGTDSGADAIIRANGEKLMLSADGMDPTTGTINIDPSGAVGINISTPSSGFNIWGASLTIDGPGAGFISSGVVRGDEFFGNGRGLTNTISLYDEGTFQQMGSSINCTGSGVSCTGSGQTLTINVTGGGGGGGGAALRLERNGVDDISVSTINITRALQYIKFTSSATFFVDLSTIAVATGTSILVPGATSYIQNSPILQVGATVYVDSATIAGLLSATTIYTQLLGVNTTSPMALIDVINDTNNIKTHPYYGSPTNFFALSGSSPAGNSIFNAPSPILFSSVFDSSAGATVISSSTFFNMGMANNAGPPYIATGTYFYISGFTGFPKFYIHQNNEIGVTPNAGQAIGSGNLLFVVADTTLNVTSNGALVLGAKAASSKFDLIGGSITVRGTNAGIISSGTIKGDALVGSTITILSSATINGIFVIKSSVTLQGPIVSSMTAQSVNPQNLKATNAPTDQASLIYDLATNQVTWEPVAETDTALSEVHVLVSTNFPGGLVLNIGSMTVKGSITSTSAVIAASGNFMSVTASTLTITSSVTFGSPLAIPFGGTALSSSPIIEVRLPASAWAPTVTSAGIVVGTIQTGTNTINMDYIQFSSKTQGTTTYYQATWSPPPGIDPSTFSYYVYWTSTNATTGSAVFSLQGLALSDGDSYANPAAYGSSVTVVDTWQANNTIHKTPESGPLTLRGNLVPGDIVYWRLFPNFQDTRYNLNSKVLILEVRIRYKRSSWAD